MEKLKMCQAPTSGFIDPRLAEMAMIKPSGLVLLVPKSSFMMLLGRPTLYLYIFYESKCLLVLLEGHTTFITYIVYPGLTSFMMGIPFLTNQYNTGS